MILPVDKKLNIQYLARLFDNMSESYKLFWFQSIVEHIIKGHDRITYDELINKMIADAWYMVSEYRLNLGPSDSIEALIKYLSKISGLKSSENESEILSFLTNSEDNELKKRKRVLILNVPYRLQSPFFINIDSTDWRRSTKELARKINNNDNLIYYFDSIDGLNSVISFNPVWSEYIRENQEIIKGWIRNNMINYLQRRNPSVPGIVNKIDPPKMRKLTKAINYWKSLSDVMEIRDIYGDEHIHSNNISLDHFVPWSYVAHDELWDLNPTTKIINSMKGNSLPVWDTYFDRLCRLQYTALEKTLMHEKVHDAFMKCKKENLNDSDIEMRLYNQSMDIIEFSNTLEGIVLPVYQSASNMGFKEWTYEG